MKETSKRFDDRAAMAIFAKGAIDAATLLSAPERIVPLVRQMCRDKARLTLEQRHLYSYSKTCRDSRDALYAAMHWIIEGQRPDGGIAAYYSLLSGYAESYPEVTGYIVPTLYDFENVIGDGWAKAAAERATAWLLTLQMPTGAFPAGLAGTSAGPSVFNTGQILFGLSRAYAETHRSEILNAARRAGDWLISSQDANGAWSGPASYQGRSHTYYSMVAWALAYLSRHCEDDRYAIAAIRHLDWALTHFQPSGWIDGINLQGHPNYLHFIAYAIQGVLECGVLCGRSDAVEHAATTARVLLRKFETNKFLCGSYDDDFSSGQRFTCVTGNAQMSCVWLRLYLETDDVRYLNAALKLNEFIKRLMPRAGRGMAGGIPGSYPIWGRYQPLRYISWGAKFFADALMLEQRAKNSFESIETEALACAS